MKKLIDVLPYEFARSYDDTPAWELRDALVVKEFFGTKPWPGKHKNVHFWVELEDGKCVGWNENPSTGWSFPVIGKNK